ncbi:hypothetical protein FB566_1444 [Stackebrandtia endophytica]|uniref:ATPase n=1 Tax=Stackebrandtia endophytica TaxID=1496996 RepID=A0A543ATL2_9ACTN|nr:ATPase [Stackebrandtia endophytica]TQL75927.1 hypothetical protein FB566_1444 [Stackebrandtia endophytica]
MIPKPAAIFDRIHEWDAICRFVEGTKPGLTIGIMRGRRRNGKSWLLEHACTEFGGVYTLALRQSRRMALDRFADTVSQAVGHPVGRFDDWVQALDTTFEVMTAGDPPRPPLLALDEFPYLVDGSPELPSVIQALYDKHAPAKNGPAFRLILCGSAISVMSRLAAGDQALRGRAILDLRINRFGIRDAADYWNVTPDVGFLIDAVLGGAPGYRDVVDDPPTDVGPGFDRWLMGNVLNPGHILFTEPDYLLAEDPRIGDRMIYHSIWESVSSGATTPTRIGGDVGMDAKALTYHLRIMQDADFLRNDSDMLMQRKPVIRVADPIVRFHNLIVRPNLADLEARRTEEVWSRSAEVFASKVLGPHFEHLAREWVHWHARHEGLEDIGAVGSTQVPCREHRGHEVDVIAVNATGMPRNKSSRITVLGEAKCTNRPRGVADVQRLDHMRRILVEQGWRADDAQLVLFSRNGFTDEIRARSDVHLVDLDRLYGRS